MATGDRWRPWWDRWYTPYLVLVLLPVVTFSISSALMTTIPDCVVDESSFKAGDIALVLAPTIADLLPFAWLLSRNRRVRAAAVIAGLIGFARFLIPVLFLIDEATPDQRILLAPPDPPGPCDDYEISLFFVLGMIFLLPILWGISAVLAGIAAFFTWPRSPKTPTAA